VVLDGNALFRIQAPRAPYTAEQRAADISNDLLSLARSREVNASTLRMMPGETDTILLAGHTFVMAVTDEDARLAGMSREELAEERRKTVEQAIAAYRRARAPWLVARGIFVAIGCWVLAGALPPWALAMHNSWRPGISTPFTGALASSCFRSRMPSRACWPQLSRCA
jgi:hypothetical protein